MNPMIIYPHHSGNMFALFYFLSFATIISFFIINGLKNKYPFHRLWLIAVTCTLFFILGSKLFAIQPSEWKNLFVDPANVSHGAKNMLGGLMGLLTGILIVTPWLRLDHRVIDFAAVGLPLAMAVSRVGCLLSGCCYGKPSALPWAACYPAGTSAFNDHAAQGLIHTHDVFSLPVQPTQVYEILACLAVAALVWRASKDLKDKGNLLILSLLLYGLARFILEFIRVPGANSFATGTWMGLKEIQWIIAGVTILLAAIIFAREFHFKISFMHQQSLKEQFFRQFSLNMFLTLLAISLFGWLDFMERITVTLFLVPSVMMCAWQLYNLVIHTGFRSAFMMVLIVGFITMSQDSIHHEADLKNFVKAHWFSVDGNYGGGAYEHVQYDCSGGVIGRYTKEYRIGSAGGAYHFKPKANHHLIAGMHLMLYSDEREGHKPDYNAFAINPYISYDMRHFGGGLGLTYFTNGDGLFPTVYLRAGPKDIFFADFRFMNDFYLAGNPAAFQMGIGSGFGKTDRSSGRMGYYSGMGDDSGFFIAGDIIIRRDVTIKFNVSFGDHINGAAGLQWHFGKNRWGRKKPVVFPI